MNKLKMKARSGVTLVELLVVVLIVTILSVSMLPLLLPFVTEAQYAAEPIPVIGNLRTKIGVYMYDKGCLPYGMMQKHPSSSAGVVETWMPTTGDNEKWDPAYFTIGATGASAGLQRCTTGNNGDAPYHIGHTSQIDVNYEDLRGKRSRPDHFQYCALSPTNNISYVVACFGDGTGLKAGTGYAVCEINLKGNQQKKFVATWKRYKPVKDEPVQFTHNNQPDVDSTKFSNCFIPTPTQIDQAAQTAAGTEPSMIGWMRDAGWEF